MVICSILQFQKDVSIANLSFPILISSKGLGYTWPFSLSVGQKYILWELILDVVVLSGLGDVLISHL
jgi:hypothetical protein